MGLKMECCFVYFEINIGLVDIDFIISFLFFGY